MLLYLETTQNAQTGKDKKVVSVIQLSVILQFAIEEETNGRLRENAKFRKKSDEVGKRE